MKGVVKIKDGKEMVMNGDKVEMEVKMIVKIEMEEKIRLDISEGGRKVGEGIV